MSGARINLITDLCGSRRRFMAPSNVVLWGEKPKKFVIGVRQKKIMKFREQ